jgi:hypothetical protein
VDYELLRHAVLLAVLADAVVDDGAPQPPEHDRLRDGLEDLGSDFRASRVLLGQMVVRSLVGIRGEQPWPIYVFPA